MVHSPQLVTAPVACGRSDVPPLRLTLLGGFRAQRGQDEQPIVDWQRRTAKTLTKLLASTPGHALHREQILNLLWPGVDLESALNSFGKALHAARRAFEPELIARQGSAYLRMTDSMLALDCEHVQIDADRFERLAEAALRHHDIGAYESALAAYGGQLLPEDRYADWCADRRTFLAELRVRAQLGLAGTLEQRGASNEAAGHLRAVLQQDPTREEVHRRLMCLYAEMGTPDQSVRQFQLCEAALRRELDLTPQHETIALYQEIIASRIPQCESRSGRDRAPAGGPVPAGRPLPAIGEPTPRTPFVGRELLLSQFAEQLARGSEGKAGMVLLRGEAGVGKTRLLEEFALRAGRQGALVLWGGSGAHAGRFAYGPFAVALEGFAAGCSEAARRELAQRYPALVPVLPSLGLEAQLPPPSDDARVDHLELAPAVVRLLTDLAQRQPVVLVLGDLHDIDHVSLDLLRYLGHLAIGRRWLTLAAVRDEEVEVGTAVHALVDAATREHLSLTLEVPCLSPGECGELVRAMLPGTEVGEELVEQIYTRSRGNPFFTEELVSELRRSGRLAIARAHGRRTPSLPARVPKGVRELAGAKTARMGETERRVLGLAAAASATPISLSDLRAGAGALDPPIPDRDVLTALDRALQARLLEERRTGYAFRYPVLRSAVYQELPRHRRDELRGALGQIGRSPEPLWNKQPASS